MGDAGLLGREIEAAVPEELVVMGEAPQITSLGQDGERVDRADPGNGAEQLVVPLVGEHRLGAALDLGALADEASSLSLGPMARQ